MVLEWSTEPQEDAPHEGIDPVSAWLFRRRSPFAAAAADSPEFPFAAAVDINDFSRTGEGSASFIGILNATGDDADLQTRDRSAATLRALKNNDPAADWRVFLMPLHPRSVQPSTPNSSKARNLLPPVQPITWSGPRPTAITAVIDHGINVFHHRFRLPQGRSRVAYAWMQGGIFDTEVGRFRGVPFGREWDRNAIEQAIAADGADEDALLRQLDADFEQPGLHPMALRASHGTHVMDMAAGHDPDDTDAELNPIIAVNLPPEVARETTGSVLGVFFIQALAYILDRARVMMGAGELDDPSGPIDVVPVMINFSFGLTGGPRGGRHLIERAIRSTIAEHHRKLEIDLDSAAVQVVLPAGNRNMSRGHFAVIGQSALHARMQLQPADPTSTFVEVRIELDGPADGFDLGLALPGADIVSHRVPADGNALLLSMAENVVGRAVLRPEAAKGTDPERVRLYTLSLAIAPTDPGLTGNTVVPPGEWQLQISAGGTHALRIDAWILRDDTPPGFRDNGRQAYFVDAGYRDRDEAGRPLAADPTGEATSPTGGIRRAGTLNAIATDRRSVVVGGVYESLNGTETAPVPYSATPMENSRRIRERLDFWAPSERSEVTGGILGAGTRSGSQVAVNGTSVAAPRVLRHLVQIQDRGSESQTDAPADPTIVI